MLATLMLLASLGLDTFGVAIGLGLSGLPRERWGRIALLFALFETGMPVIGLVLGRTIASAAGPYAVTGSALLLILVGVSELREIFEKDDDPEPSRSASGPPSHGRAKWLLIALSISLDELAVGFTLGLLPFPVIAAFAWIAVQAVAATLAGLWSGARVGHRFQEFAERIAGAIWILVGIRLIVESTLGR